MKLASRDRLLSLDGFRGLVIAMILVTNPAHTPTREPGKHAGYRNRKLHAGTGATDPSFKSGVFYASAEKKLTGPVIDQSEVFPDLANHVFREHAVEAIHKFL